MVTTRGPIGLYLSGIDVISDGLGGNPENPCRLHCSIKQNRFDVSTSLHYIDLWGFPNEFAFLMPIF